MLASPRPICVAAKPAPYLCNITILVVHHVQGSIAGEPAPCLCNTADLVRSCDNITATSSLGPIRSCGPCAPDCLRGCIHDSHQGARHPNKHPTWVGLPWELKENLRCDGHTRAGRQIAWHQNQQCSFNQGVNSSRHLKSDSACSALHPQRYARSLRGACKKRIPSPSQGTCTKAPARQKERNA